MSMIVQYQPDINDIAYAADPGFYKMLGLNGTENCKFCISRNKLYNVYRGVSGALRFWWSLQNKCSYNKELRKLSRNSRRWCTYYQFDLYTFVRKDKLAGKLLFGCRDHAFPITGPKNYGSGSWDFFC